MKTLLERRRPETNTKEHCARCGRNIKDCSHYIFHIEKRLATMCVDCMADFGIMIVGESNSMLKKLRLRACGLPCYPTGILVPTKLSKNKDGTFNLIFKKG